MKHNGETQRSSLLSATLQDLPDQPEALTRARAFAQPLLMGATLAPCLSHLPLPKALGALFFMCDESWAMGLADARQRGGFSLCYFMGVSLSLWITWVTFTSLGTQIGPLLGDLRSYGFDMAFAAVFLVLLKGLWKGVHAALPWLFSLFTAALFYLLIPIAKQVYCCVIAVR